MCFFDLISNYCLEMLTWKLGSCPDFFSQQSERSIYSLRIKKPLGALGVLFYFFIFEGGFEVTDRTNGKLGVAIMRLLEREIWDEII